jgi:glycosyltransferase involved in cell wall biosynthesis
MRPFRSDLIGSAAAAAPRTEPIRVLFLTAGVSGGGIGRVAGELLTRMNRNRFILTHCSLRDLGTTGASLARTVPSTSHLLRHPLDLTAVIRLGRQLKGRVDAVLTVGSSEPMWWGCVAGRWARIPVVLSLLDPHERPVPLVWPNRLVVQWSDGLIVDRHEQRQHLVKRQGLEAAAIHIIPPGIDTCRFNFQPADAFAGRRRFQVASGAPLCGFWAGGWSAQSVQRVLDVVRRVRFQFPSAQFVLFARAADSASPSATRQRLNLARSAEGIHIVDDADDLPRVLPALNVFSVMGPAPPHPLPVWQAMAAHVPVVAARECDLGGKLDVNDMEHWVALKDVSELPRHIIQLISDPLRARQVGERGRQFVLTHRSLDLMVRRYEQLIVETYQRKRSGLGAALPASLHDTVEFCGAAS